VLRLRLKAQSLELHETVIEIMFQYDPFHPEGKHRLTTMSTARGGPEARAGRPSLFDLCYPFTP
jgi:hypothetical protein